MKSKLIPLARTFRKKQTDAENLLWGKLRNRQLEGMKFRRQHPIGNYVVDFVCIKKKIVIEADGSQHCHSEEDIFRDTYLEAWPKSGVREKSGTEF